MTPEYMAIRGVAEYLGRSFRTLERWKQHGYLPPHAEWTRKIHMWKRTDLDAWSEMKMRGLLDDWIEVRGRLGAIDGWALMLERLDAAKAKTAAVVAQEVTR